MCDVTTLIDVSGFCHRKTAQYGTMNAQLLQGILKIQIGASHLFF